MYKRMTCLLLCLYHTGSIISIQNMKEVSVEDSNNS